MEVSECLSCIVVWLYTIGEYNSAHQRLVVVCFYPKVWALVSY